MKEVLIRKRSTRQQLQHANLKRTDTDIQDAVRLWLEDQATAEARYGHISRWDTSAITNMSDLFNAFVHGKEDDEGELRDDNPIFNFNEDLSGWITSSVNTMQNMFRAAHSFDCDLSAWDTSSVTSMSFMFSGAHSFNCGGGDLGLWNTAAVDSMMMMFDDARSFRCDISRWNIYLVPFAPMYGDFRMFQGCPVNFTQIWRERKNTKRKKDENWKRRRACMMVASPFLRNEGRTRSPLQVLFDVQVLFRYVMCYV